MFVHTNKMTGYYLLFMPKNDWLESFVHTKQWLAKSNMLFIQKKLLARICCSYKKNYWLESVVQAKKWLA